MLKVLTFRVGSELFGVEITKIKEINRNIEYTVVPRVKSNIVGLFNMRGQVVTLFDLAIMLGYEQVKQQGRVTSIILKEDTASPNQKGFVIDKTGDVIDVADDMCEFPPPNADEFENKYLKAVVKSEIELLRIIDVDKLFEDYLSL